MPIDWSDPCAALVALRQTHYELISGQAVARVRLPDREVEYTQATVKDLAAEITRLEGECAAKTTGRARRFAITAGYRG